MEGFGDADDFPVPGLIGEGCGSALGAVEVMGCAGFAGLGGGAAPRVSVKPCSAASAGGAVSATST